MLANGSPGHAGDTLYFRVVRRLPTPYGTVYTVYALVDPSDSSLS